MNTTNIETTIEGPHDTVGRSYRRQQRTAVKQGAEGHATVQLRVEAELGFEGFYVTWTRNKGAGWGKAWRKGGFATEAAALAFAEEKWSSCLAYLEKVEPVRGASAASIWKASL